MVLGPISPTKEKHPVGTIRDVLDEEKPASDLRSQIEKVLFMAPFIADLGVTLVEAGPGWLETELAVVPRLRQQHGYVTPASSPPSPTTLPAAPLPPRCAPGNRCSQPTSRSTSFVAPPVSYSAAGEMWSKLGSGSLSLRPTCGMGKPTAPVTWEPWPWSTKRCSPQRFLISCRTSRWLLRQAL